MVKLTWLGHACFLIEGKAAKILLDPYEPRAFPGFELDIHEFDELLADVSVVISTHDHADHNYFDAAPTASKVKAIEVAGREVEVAPGATMLSHLVDHGAGRGPCAAVLLTVDSVKVYHFADTYSPRLSELESIGSKGVDVALVPVGGLYTMGPREAVKAIRALKPKKVIPMHYRIPGVVTLVPSTLDQFLGAARGVVEAEVVPLSIGESVEV